MQVPADMALLLALDSGPGFGLELIRRVGDWSEGAVRVNRGGAYLSLRRLERAGLVRGWLRQAGVGRPRRYYELTPPGIQRVSEVRRSLLSLLGGEGSGVSGREDRAMAERVSRAAALSASMIQLREAGRSAGL